MSEMLKLIFLDFDGVLNSWKSIQIYRREHGGENIREDDPHPIHVIHLNEINRRTGATIIVSSTWRLRGIDYVRKILKDSGVEAEVLGVTPRLIGETRGLEIYTFLRIMKFSNLKSFVIIDDDSDMDFYKPHLVQTNFDYGLCKKHVRKAISILNKPFDIFPNL